MKNKVISNIEDKCRDYILSKNEYRYNEIKRNKVFKIRHMMKLIFDKEFDKEINPLILEISSILSYFIEYMDKSTIFTEHSYNEKKDKVYKFLKHELNYKYADEIMICFNYISIDDELKLGKGYYMKKMDSFILLPFLVVFDAYKLSSLDISGLFNYNINCIEKISNFEKKYIANELMKHFIHIPDLMNFEICKEKAIVKFNSIFNRLISNNMSGYEIFSFAN